MSSGVTLQQLVWPCRKQNSISFENHLYSLPRSRQQGAGGQCLLHRHPRQALGPEWPCHQSSLASQWPGRRFSLMSSFWMCS